MENDDMFYAIETIAYAHLFYEHGKFDKFMALGYEQASAETSELWWDALGLAAESIWSNPNDEHEVYAWYFSNRSMTEYNRLSRVYGSVHHLKLKDNPYLQAAERFVGETMDWENRYGYGWYLNTKIGHAWASGLVFKTDYNDFYGEFELLSALLDIQDWYSSAVYQLRRKLLEDCVLHLPALPSHQEVSAA